MDTSVIIAFIAAAQAIGVAIIGGLFARSKAETDAYRSRRDREQAERDARREKRDVAILALNFACAEGTEVLLEYAHGEQMNGNVDKALEGIENARKNLNRIINEEAMKL